MKYKCDYSRGPCKCCAECDVLDCEKRCKSNPEDCGHAVESDQKAEEGENE